MRAAHTFIREKGVCTAMFLEVLGALAALVTIAEFLMELPTQVSRFHRWISAQRMARKERKKRERLPGDKRPPQGKKIGLR